MKFLGDGFFAVHPYEDTDIKFVENLKEVLEKIYLFQQQFSKDLKGSNIPKYEKLLVCFGISYGICNQTLTTDKNQTKLVDYIGRKINLSSRLCSVAKQNFIVIDNHEKNMAKIIEEYIPELKYKKIRVNLKGFFKRRKTVLLKEIYPFNL